MELQDENVLSDMSDEVMSPPITKCELHFGTTSSEEEEILSDSSDINDSYHSLEESILSISESEDYKGNNNDFNEKEWSDPIGNQPRLIPFESKVGLRLLSENCTKVEDFYKLLVTEEIFQRIVEQTNLHAVHILNQKQSSRLNDWIPTNTNEIKQFFGLIMWMGLVKLPKLHLYWSKDHIFSQSFPHSIMSRNRFELILRVLHFANNEEQNSSNCLYKINTIVNTLNENFQKYYNAGEILCFDEALIKYVEQDNHKYSIKIFKLYSTPGYTNTFQIHCDKCSNAQRTDPTNVVMTLCKNIYGKGHTLCVNSCYTSIDLANKLVAANTHLVGTIRANCDGISKEVVNKKLKHGELFAKEHKSGITLLKWRDKRNVLLLSTKHSTETVTIIKRRQNYTRPKVIVDYNKAKSFIKLFNQVTVDSIPLRKNVKWYKKLVLELLLNTSVINAWIMYKANHGSISIIDFKRQLIMYLTHCQNEDTESHNLSPTIMETKRKHHEIKKKEGKTRHTRKRCSLCYMNNVKIFGSQRARSCTIRVVTYCDDCPDKPYLCLPCFNTKHRSMPF